MMHPKGAGLFARIAPEALVAALILGGLSLTPLFGQSLADLARQERAKKAQEKKPEKVFTNDDIPSTGSITTAAPPKEGEVKASAEGKGEAKPKEEAGPDMAALEKEYRAKFAALRDKLDFEQKKLDVDQRELNLMQTQYYSNPNDALREQTFRGQINQRTQEVEQQKGAVDKAQKAVADLEEELRKKGLPAGWAR